MGKYPKEKTTHHPGGTAGWKSSSEEVDFILSKKNMIVPVEINGGAAGKLKSMHQLLEKYPHIERGYVLSTAPYGELREQKLVFLPLYYAYSLAGGQ